jgi:type I restriction enzyme, S subunit
MSTTKQSTVKKSNAPKLRFKEFREPYSNSKIESIVEFRSGGTPSMDNPNYWNGNIPWISASSMLGKYYSESDRTITELGLSNGSKLAKKGSLLLLTRGSMLFNKIPIGFAEVDVAFNQDLKNLIVSNHSTGEFIYQWFQSKEQLLMNKVVGTGIGAGKLETPDLKNLSIFLPSLPEQQKIASFLSAVDEKIQQLTRKKELLEQYKKGVMQQLFSGKLRFKDENGKPYPKWEEKPFGAICTFINGRAYKQEELLKEGKYRVLRVGNLFSNNEWYYSDLELEQDKYLEKGDLMYAWSASFGPRFWEDEKIIYHYHIWKVIASAEVDKLYLFHAFMFDVERIKAVSQGGTMFHITKGNIETRKFKFPCLEEQQKIASCLTALDSKIDRIAALISNTQTFKKGLLQQMFV